MIRRIPDSGVIARVTEAMLFRRRSGRSQVGIAKVAILKQRYHTLPCRTNSSHRLARTAVFRDDGQPDGTMKVAIITPYCTEGWRVLEACIESVRAQTVPADHFLIADGTPLDQIDGIAGVRHIRLDQRHDDYGATPRMIGFLLAVAEEYDAIGFLDTDHRLSPDHVAVCSAVAEARPGIDIVIATANLFAPRRIGLSGGRTGA